MPCACVSLTARTPPLVRVYVAAWQSNGRSPRYTPYPINKVHIGQTPDRRRGSCPLAIMIINDMSKNCKHFFQKTAQKIRAQTVHIDGRLTARAVPED